MLYAEIKGPHFHCFINSSVTMSPLIAILTIITTSLLCPLKGDIFYDFNNSTSFDEFLSQLSNNNNIIPVTSSINLRFNTSTVFSLSSNFFFLCHSNEQMYVSLYGYQSSTIPAVIRCSPTGRRPGQLGFHHCQVSINSIVFDSCGDIIPRRSSSYHFSIDLTISVALYCIKCSSFVCENVMFVSTYGSAIVAKNTATIEFDSFNVSNSSTQGGILLYYDQFSLNVSVIISKTSFTNLPGNHGLLPVLSHEFDIDEPLHIASGLSIIMYKYHNKATVSLNSVVFTNVSNTCLLLVYCKSVHVRTNINGLEFIGNKRYTGFHGNKHVSAMLYYYSYDWCYKKCLVHPLNISDIVFKDNHMLELFSLYIRVSEHTVLIKVSNVTFSNNVLSDESTCLNVNGPMYNENHGLMLELTNVSAIGNQGYASHHVTTPRSIMLFTQLLSIVFNGINVFTDNNMGSMIDVTNSILHLHGTFNCTSNHGYIGTCIYLHGWSLIHMHNELVANFIDNTAQVFASTIFGYRAGAMKCLFYVYTDPLTNGAPRMVFRNNTSYMYDITVYAYPIIKCKLCNNATNNSWDEIKLFMDFGKPVSAIDSSDLSTRASRLEVKVNTGNKELFNSTDGHEEHVKLFPGQNFSLTINTKDDIGRNVWSTVRVVMMPSPGIEDVWLSDLFKHDYEWNIPGTDDGLRISTSLNVRFNSSVPFNFTHYNVIMAISLSDNPFVYFQFNIQLENCPLQNFMFNHKSGACDCLFAIHTFFKHNNLSIDNIDCKINNGLIQFTRPTLVTSGWLGKDVINDTLALSLSLSCPINHCNSNPDYKVYVVNTTDIFITDHLFTVHKDICLSGRAGPLCGECPNDTSMVFWSSECKRCSNWWLLMMVPYALGGVLLLVIIFIFNITLTVGKFNSMFFFAQICFAGLIDILQYGHQYFKDLKGPISGFAQICNVFITIMNLSFGPGEGFSMCFFHKMTQIHKTGISLVYPFYMLSLVILISVISARWTWLARRIVASSVQVISTILHFSFSMMLLVFIDVFTRSYIYNANGHTTVWYFDGSKHYCKNDHLILAICTVAVTTPLILSYLFFLVFTKTLMKKYTFVNKYIRPFYEAIHAPYKPSKEYFFFLRIVVLIFFYIIYSVHRSSDPFAIYVWCVPALCIYLVLQVHFKPFNDILINHVDSFVVLSIIMTYVLTWYFFHPVLKQIHKELIVCITEVFLVFTMFVVTFVVHILKPEHRQWIINRLIFLFQVFWSRIPTKDTVTLSHENNPPPSNIDSSFYGSCSQYREPVLND